MIQRTLSCAALAAMPLAAFAHDGHGFAGSHWHSTDVWGFAVTVALMAAALWFARRK